jgi:hypothetical protein
MDYDELESAAEEEIAAYAEESSEPLEPTPAQIDKSENEM